VEVELRALCQARSGDKADRSDISLFAPNQAVYEVLRREVTAERVRDHFRGLVAGEVRRYEVPGVLALKFVLDRALGGGGPSSLRIDNLGKAMGSAILRLRVDVPEELLTDPSLPARSPRGRVGLPPARRA
jgi:hypothetical protein